MWPWQGVSRLKAMDLRRRVPLGPVAASELSVARYVGSRTALPGNACPSLQPLGQGARTADRFALMVRSTETDQHEVRPE